MINIPLEQIDKAAIDSLIANTLSEDRGVEFKESLPTEADRNEFLADVSSLANASGGDLIYGIKEKRDQGKPTGEAEAAVGVGNVNVDAEILRLENWLRDCIDPRIPGYRIKPVGGFPNGAVIFIRIPKSWASPHMIKNSSKFFSRNSRGKYQLDVREIRAAFALSDALPERIRRFRDDRLARIIADETPMPLVAGAKIILHVLPIAAFDPQVNMDVALMKEKVQDIRPMRTMGWTPRYNFDGFLWFSQPSPPATQGYTYVQLFRNGAIEMVEASLLAFGREHKIIPSTAFEREIIDGLGRCLIALKTLEFQPPVFVMLTLLNIKGFIMWRDGSWDNVIPIDRDVLVLPEKIVENYDEKPDQILRPMFNGVWQATGFAFSPNYDEDGNRRPNA